MNQLGFFLVWYNIPFTVALGSSLILALLQVFSGFGDSDTADADVDVDADIDIDIDADVAALGETPDVAHTGSTLKGALSALGIGHVPVLLMLMIFLSSFGAVGLVSNIVLVSFADPYPALGFLPLLGGVLIITVLVTGRISRVFARLAPRRSAAISFEQLVGRTGTVVSSTANQSYGRVAVRDQFGSRHTVYAVIEQGEPLPEHSEVALLAYDAIQRRFLIKALHRP